MTSTMTSTKNSIIEKYITRQFPKQPVEKLMSFVVPYVIQYGEIYVDEECDECRDEDFMNYVQKHLMEEDEEEDMDMTTCYACDELFDNDDLSAMCQRENCKIHGPLDDGSFDPRSLCKDCFVNNNPAADEHLEAKKKKHKRKKLVIIDAPPPKWHEKCSKCQNTKHDRDWIYCLQNRAYCGACSPSWGCDFDYCQACNC